MILDFDEVATWEQSLVGVLGEFLAVRLPALELPHQYVEDSLRTLLASNDKQRVIELTLGWIASNSVAAYHGTRLTVDELASVQNKGLRPLVASDRKIRLMRALSRHPRWASVQDGLDAAIARGGHGAIIGNRSGQVHLTLSKAGLTRSFNHYIAHGSEFDQHIAHQLLGQDGVNLLGQDGDPYVLRFLVPGSAAIQAAHRIFSPSDVMANGDVPNIADEFLKILSYRISDPSYTPDRLRADCGLVFTEAVPASWLVDIESKNGESKNGARLT